MLVDCIIGNLGAHLVYDPTKALDCTKRGTLGQEVKLADRCLRAFHICPMASTTCRRSTRSAHGGRESRDEIGVSETTAALVRPT